MGKNEFLFCSVLYVRIITTLRSGKHFISFYFVLINLFIISKHFILRANYCAGWYPRVMKYGSYFLRNEGPCADQGVCCFRMDAGEVTG